MGGEVPLTVGRLLAALDGDSRDAAWDRLIAEHSDLLLRVARSLGGDQDAAMDRYTHILEQLRRDDFHRLRSYVPSEYARFTTWLVVVARRLCLDQIRHCYGRLRGSRPADLDASRARRRLSDLVARELNVLEVADPNADHPVARMSALRGAETLHSALAALDADDRLLLKLRFEDELPAREIATLMHLPTVFHAYRRLNALLASLRRTLEDAGVDDAQG